MTKVRSHFFGKKKSKTGLPHRIHRSKKNRFKMSHNRLMGKYRKQYKEKLEEAKILELEKEAKEILL